MEISLIDIIGWLGFLLCSISYLLLNFNVIRYDRPWFQYLNLLGGMGLVVSSLFFGDLPNAAANFIWVAIAFLGVWRYAWRKRSLRRSQDVKPQ